MKRASHSVSEVTTDAAAHDELDNDVDVSVQRRSFRDRDDGAALILVLVAVVICSLMVVPLLTYATAVTRSTRVLQHKSIRTEAVKGGLRTALANPIELYRRCGATAVGPNPPNGLRLASPSLDVDVQTDCYKLSVVREADADKLRYGLATTQVGSTVPADVPDDTVYPGTNYPASGGADPAAWIASSSAKSDKDKIWLPNLVAHALNQRSATGYSMPSGFPACTVYFPGTYRDPLVITGSTPVYFTSGVYYFESDVRFSGNANVVIGAGTNVGCTDDQEATFYATDAPVTHNIGGLGATFVFGAAGRLVVDTAVAGTTSVIFNQRYVADGDTTASAFAGVSIVSVNGAMSGTTHVDLDVPGSLRVPRSMIDSTPPVSAVDRSYKVSTLVPSPITTPAGPAVPAIVDVSLTTAQSVKLFIPGYIAVPQGQVRIGVLDAASAASKDIHFGGGVVAAQYQITAIRPATLVVGTNNPAVQKVFKIVSTTTAGAPKVTSTAIVQVNENGGYAINSWEVQ